MVRVTHLITGLECGGAEQALFTLIDQGCKTDPSVEHYVIALARGPYLEKIEDCGVVVEVVGGAFSAYDPIGLYKIYEAVKDSQPDIIHTSLWATGVLGRLAGWLLGVPVICDIHSNASFHGWLRNTIDRWTVCGNVAYVAVSDSVKEAYVQAMGRSVPADTVTVIMNGIDIDGVRAHARQRAYTRAAEGFGDPHMYGIVWVGRLEKIKGCDIMLKAFLLLVRRLKKEGSEVIPVLSIIGDGSQFPRLQRFIKQHRELEEHCLLWGERDDVRDCIGLYDCFAMTSYSEGLSYVLIEALCFQLPLIITHEGKKHDLVEDGVHAQMVTPGDIEAFSQALYDEIMRTNGKGRRIKKSLALVRQNCARSVMVEKFYAMYRTHRMKNVL